MPDHDFRAQRLYVDAALGPDASVLLAPEQAHYVANVIRLAVGQALLLFNGRDGEWRATRVAGGKRDVRFEVSVQVRPQPVAPTLEYAFAPLKHARLDYMVQKAVEMGAGVLSPVITRYTQVSRINLDRMAANAAEAAEQCGILSLPRVAEPRPLAQWLDALPAERVLVFCDEAAADHDPIHALRTAPGGPVSVLIGPEGGFSPDERALIAPRAVTLSLGPRILRADTAAVAALALVGAARGG
ncbi:16S rRNA (uracil(1498)-N(3))-methyltransferase [Xanthobacter oligotrophicus]|uniref:16S rRNA (uracil(1498)-N(3))-methyltransferase n=1 Tax=Xanthobacter oligotrophicus TaxID=2607286 RepID=UPI0011F313E1|nr:16S rRNA (uracil(1498)-N(3))-methyltransferase [Xanthobacter oligotrophicus]MCG5234046.1 16S rRNA (uracil(1498)-N(3))-methyltransferase [Xanthobacter oligotrophicus]